MRSTVGLTLEERIRRSLTPLCGPLRIDGFVILMHRERSRKAAEDARRKRAAEERRAAREPERADASGEIPSTGEHPSADVNDSAHLRAEVAEFLKRDQVAGSDAGEVADFMDFLGGGLAPDEPAT